MKLASCLLSVTLLTGACSGSVSLTSVKSKGVEQIPTRVGLYPIMSTSMRGASDGRVFGATLRMSDESIVIAPPAETELSLTGESRMLTDLVSTGLASYGFELTELPFELVQTDEGEASSGTAFVLTTDLLETLRDHYELDAILIGNAFFWNRHHTGTLYEHRVTFVHLRLVDLYALKILAQITLPYDVAGESLNGTAQQLALELAKLAGLSPAITPELSAQEDQDDGL